jgi:hypothetical protein
VTDQQWLFSSENSIPSIYTLPQYVIYSFAIFGDAIMPLQLKSSATALT